MRYCELTENAAIPTDVIRSYVPRYTMLGSGSRGVVVKSGEFAYKFYIDPAYDAFVDNIENLTNPYLPTIYDRAVLENGIRVVKLELLKKVPKQIAVAAMAGLATLTKRGDIGTSTRSLFPDTNSFVEVGKIINATGHDLDSVDVGNNVMRRGQTLVFTDPVAAD